MKSDKGHIAFYRKYRPQNFEEVRGQDHVVAILSNAVKLNRVSHAYLFSGPRGTGKTTAARVLAKAVNCDDFSGKGSKVPCGKCSSCEEFISGNNLDLIEIDAASSRGIDEIRALREAVRLSPFKSAYKIYIIDEVHMLTREAFNALLKTLEEPPKHAIFILATTDPEKVPGTIFSRCQRFEFKKIPEKVIMSSLSDISRKEGLSADEEALAIIAISSDGSFRDAQVMLDQLASMGLKKITDNNVREVFGIPPRHLVEEFISALMERKPDGAFKAVASAAEQNFDPRMFIKLALRQIRPLLLLKISPSMEKELLRNMTQSEAEFVFQKRAVSDQKTLELMMSSLIDAYEASFHSYIPHLPIELAIMKVVDDLNNRS